MNCQFDLTQLCIESEIFNKWLGDKRETAFLTLDFCPECPIYSKAIEMEEVINEVAQGEAIPGEDTGAKG